MTKLIDGLLHLKYKWTTWLYNYVKKETIALEKVQQVVSNLRVSSKSLL